MLHTGIPEVFNAQEVAKALRRAGLIAPPRVASPSSPNLQPGAQSGQQGTDPYIVTLPRGTNGPASIAGDRVDAARVPPPLPARPILPTVSGPSRGEVAGSEIDRADNGPAPTMVALPVVIYPNNPNESAMTAGAGFFISRDGSAITAAHVVKDCKSIQVASRFLRPIRASVRAIDAGNDIAVVRMIDGRPPAVIGLVERTSTTRTLDIRGYPGDGSQLIPTATGGTLLAEKPAVEKVDSRDLLWMEAKAVRPGFSGGPVLTDRGEALGVVNGVMLVRVKRNGAIDRELRYVYGASTRMITAFLTASAPSLVPDGREYLSTEDVNKAVVRVICSH